MWCAQSTNFHSIDNTKFETQSHWKHNSIWTNFYPNYCYKHDKSNPLAWQPTTILNKSKATQQTSSNKWLFQQKWRQNAEVQYVRKNEDLKRKKLNLSRSQFQKWKHKRQLSDHQKAIKKKIKRKTKHCKT